MKRIILTAVCMVAMGALFMQTGCAVMMGDRPVYAEKGPPPWAPAHGYRAKYHYYYYPEANVYFDAGRNLYFYCRNGAWLTSVSLPSGIHVSASQGVSIDMDTDRPYVYHSDVVKRYPPRHFKKEMMKGNKKKMMKGNKKRRWVDR